MKVTERFADKTGRPLIALDFSPPRSGDPGFTSDITEVDADFICVAYSPGKSVRLDSMVAAATIKWNTRKEVIFNLSTRDMNKLAIQTHLLGAQALEVENVLVMKGDAFSKKELTRLKDVSDYTPTELLTSIRAMNEGVDFKGLKRLRAPTTFCVGAIADLGRGVDKEALLVQRKVQAGAEFIVTQSVYDAAQPKEFMQRYGELAGKPIPVPVMYGVPVLTSDGVVFGEVPAEMKRQLEKGRSGAEIALELLHSLMDAGFDAFYVIPPILKGGDKDYTAAAEVIEAIKKR